MGTEIEVKLAASKKTLERFERMEKINDWKMEKKGKLHLLSHYFDTNDFRLLYNNIAYRLREEDGKKVATLKSNGKKRNGIYIREEKNVLLSDSEDVTSCDFLKKHFPEVLNIAKGRELTEVLTIDNERHILHLIKGNAVIEASCDYLNFLKGRRKISYNELELELKKGTEEDLAECASFLRLNFHLPLSGASKYEMGLRSFNLIPLF